MLRNTSRKLNVTIPNTPTVLATIDIRGATTIRVQGTLAGHALSALEFRARVSNDAPYMAIMIYNEGINAAEVGNLMMVPESVAAFASLQISAASAHAEGSTMSLYWCIV